MSGTKKMMLRVQSSEGTARVEILDTDTTSLLYERVHDALNLNSFGFALHKDRARKEEISSSKSRQLRDYGLRHGDLLYLGPVNGAVLFDQPSTSAEPLSKPLSELSTDAGPSTVASPSSVAKSSELVEHEVDLLLYSISGNIQRERDEKLCRHNSKGCCVHCSALEPWDENYLKEHNIKHMSFHSYLKKMTSGRFVALEELSCKIKSGCKEHPPWPRGICTSCQPGAVTLTRQPYRHVDNVLMEHAAPVERFLAYWRATGHQRVGFLYGRYEHHPDVPLGIRARVAAVYEPPQESSQDAVRLEADPLEGPLAALAARLGLERVGWIFTDLLPLDLNAGTVQRLRGADAHFLSAQECITAGHFQNRHPNVCRHASSGHFGSKFVTVCASGDASNRIHLEGYQVSGQCAALVRDGILLPTKDAPELGYIRDCSREQYVPDVYYKKKDEYDNEVSESAKRLPVEFLLLDVPVGVAPDAADTTFDPRASFPPAHRPLQGHVQSLGALHDAVARAPSFLSAAADLHVLLFLATDAAAALSPAQLAPLLAAVRARDAAAADAWRASPPGAALLARAAAAAAAPGPAAALWTCPLCTFHNAAPLDACEMCAMPRNAV